ncbi:MAG: hypothetical protein ACTSRP_02490 [Candidatus Helarchaeota archaeon]
MEPKQFNPLELDENDIQKIKRIVKRIISEPSVQCAAFIASNETILEKIPGINITERTLYPILSKIMNICNWGIKRINNNEVSYVQIGSKDGTIILKSYKINFIGLLIFDKNADKNDIDNVSRLFFDEIEETVNIPYYQKGIEKVNSIINNLKTLIENMKTPKLSEIKELLTYFSE